MDFNTVPRLLKRRGDFQTITDSPRHDELAKKFKNINTQRKLGANMIKCLEGLHNTKTRVKLACFVSKPTTLWLVFKHGKR